MNLLDATPCIYSIRHRDIDRQLWNERGPAEQLTHGNHLHGQDRSLRPRADGRNPKVTTAQSLEDGGKALFLGLAGQVSKHVFQGRHGAKGPFEVWALGRPTRVGTLPGLGRHSQGRHGESSVQSSQSSEKQQSSNYFMGRHVHSRIVHLVCTVGCWRVRGKEMGRMKKFGGGRQRNPLIVGWGLGDVSATHDRFQSQVKALPPTQIQTVWYENRIRTQNGGQYGGC